MLFLVSNCKQIETFQMFAAFYHYFDQDCASSSLPFYDIVASLWPKYGCLSYVTKDY